MTRRDRPQLERLDAIGYAVNRVSGSARDILLFVAIGMALGVALIVYALTAGDVTMALGGAGIGGVLGIVYVLTLAWDLSKAALALQRTQPEGDDFPYARTSERTLTRLPDGVTEHDLWQYMIGIATERVTLSQRGAAEYDMTQEQSNDVKDWLVQRGWIEITNPANGHWDWTDTGERVRDLLRERPPATWNRIVREVQGE